jgi:hypothetical protein
MSSESCRKRQPDFAEERVEVGRDLLIEAVEPMALLLGKRGVGCEGSEETGSQWA